jgi:hypothetical protein
VCEKPKSPKTMPTPSEEETVSSEVELRNRKRSVPEGVVELEDEEQLEQVGREYDQ